MFSKLSTEDKVGCRSVCKFFKKEVDSILKKKDRLWLRIRKYEPGHYFCYDKNHTIFSRDTLYFDKTICIKNLNFVSALMPFLKILQLDPFEQLYREEYDLFEYDEDCPDYRDEKNNVVYFTKIFPQVACFILPGLVERCNFYGNLSQVKHLTISGVVYRQRLPKFPNLDSLECSHFRQETDDDLDALVMPSKRFVVPLAQIQWRDLPQTLESIEAELKYDGYISIGKPHFLNLKILKSHSAMSRTNPNLETLMNFLKDHKGSLTELSFSAEKKEKVVNLKAFVPLLTQLHKLSVKIETVEHAIDLKEIKALANNLQYFELWVPARSGTQEHFGKILENLPLGLDNLSIEDDWCDGVSDTFMRKIIEKIVNGHTKRVTIAGIGDGNPTEKTIEKIMRMKPEGVKVEKRNLRVREEDHSNFVSRTEYCTYICNIIISL